MQLLILNKSCLTLNKSSPSYLTFYSWFCTYFLKEDPPLPKSGSCPSTGHCEVHRLALESPSRVFEPVGGPQALLRLRGDPRPASSLRGLTQGTHLLQQRANALHVAFSLEHCDFMSQVADAQSSESSWHTRHGWPESCLWDVHSWPVELPGTTVVHVVTHHPPGLSTGALGRGPCLHMSCPDCQCLLAAHTQDCPDELSSKQFKGVKNKVQASYRRL